MKENVMAKMSNAIYLPTNACAMESIIQTFGSSTVEDAHSYQALSSDSKFIFFFLLTSAEH